MKQRHILDEGETLSWEARPAPRCYTFRHWRHCLFGMVFLAICSYWQVLGISMAELYRLPWLAWLPLPFVLLGLYFSCGHLVQARLEWNNVYYAITDRRVIVLRGLVKSQMETLNLSEITYFKLHQHSPDLGTLHIHKGREAKLILHCIEHPRRATTLIENILAEKIGDV